MAEALLTDSNALDQYLDLLGEEGAAFIIDIIETFLEEAPENLKLLGESYSSADFSTFRRAAHTMKTGCSTVGASDLADQFFSLEEAGASEDFNPVGGILKECISNFELLKVELDKKRNAMMFQKGN